jgi:hypothetical protein
MTPDRFSVIRTYGVVDKWTVYDHHDERPGPRFLRRRDALRHSDYLNLTRPDEVGR